MSKCLNCQKELQQTPNKRTKLFCNSTCRSNYWQKQSRKSQNKPIPAPKAEKPVQNIQKKLKPVNEAKNGIKKESENLLSNIEFKKPDINAYDGNKLDGIKYDEHCFWSNPTKDAKNYVKNDSEIEKLIERIKNEKIPKERDTALGRKVWKVEQEKRILELQKQKNA